MSGFFSVISSADVGFRKPHAGCFLPALRHQVDPVGPDGRRQSDTDVEALALGMTAVLTQQYRRGPGSRHQPHHVIGHLRDLIPSPTRLSSEDAARASVGMSDERQSRLR
jgi:FMN phosphatase YigB (HAD superfamily)